MQISADEWISNLVLRLYAVESLIPF